MLRAPAPCLGRGALRQLSASASDPLQQLRALQLVPARRCLRGPHPYPQPHCEHRPSHPPAQPAQPAQPSQRGSASQRQPATRPPGPARTRLRSLTLGGERPGGARSGDPGVRSEKRGGPLLPGCGKTTRPCHQGSLQLLTCPTN